MLSEPTRGVDVGARREIHRLLRELAASGAAVLTVTSDIDEAVALSDRLLVFRNGEIAREIKHPGPAAGTDALHAAGGLT